jgi:hypothetical protein
MKSELFRYITSKVMFIFKAFYFIEEREARF